MGALEKTVVKIIDMKGRILHSQKIGTNKGFGLLDISGADLNVGSYICRIIQGNKERNIQFTKA